MDINVTGLLSNTLYVPLPNGTLVSLGTATATAANLASSGLSPGWGYYQISPEAQQVNVNIVGASTLAVTTGLFFLFSPLFPFTPNMVSGVTTSTGGYGTGIAVPSGVSTNTIRYSLRPNGTTDSGQAAAGANVAGKYILPCFTAATWTGGTLAFSMDMY